MLYYSKNYYVITGSYLRQTVFIENDKFWTNSLHLLNWGPAVGQNMLFCEIIVPWIVQVGHFRFFNIFVTARGVFGLKNSICMRTKWDSQLCYDDCLPWGWRRIRKCDRIENCRLKASKLSYLYSGKCCSHENNLYSLFKPIVWKIVCRFSILQFFILWKHSNTGKLMRGFPKSWQNTGLPVVSFF